jgi:surface polysaccharide O-acyltransferase-like enzyme
MLEATENSVNSVFSLPVDLIRTVAIFLVLLLHACTEYYVTFELMSPQGIQLWWASNVYGSFGRMSVPLFVMLTGALLLQPSKCNEPLGVFFKKRWSRLGVPVIFWMAIFFLWDFFAKGQALTSTFIFHGVLVGPAVHFWYLYLLIGLYLITPIVRVVVAHANWTLIRYFLVLWFIGTGLVSLLTLVADISSQGTWFRDNVFLLTGIIGYFVLGAYVGKLKFRPAVLWVFFVLGTLCTIFATYFIIGTLGERYSQFFLDASSFNVIIASVTFFLILGSILNQKIEVKMPWLSRVLRVISLNTLPIYLFHVIVLETLQKGYLGFKISVAYINPVLEIPLLAGLTLLICLAIIVPLKKVPYVNRIIG